MAITNSSDGIARRHFVAGARGQHALTLYQHEVEELMATSAPFDEIEDAIDDAELPAAHKAALWLLAWSLREPWLQLREARTTLAMVANH
jgi:hypothetical protein